MELTLVVQCCSYTASTQVFLKFLRWKQRFKTAKSQIEPHSYKSSQVPKKDLSWCQWKAFWCRIWRIMISIGLTLEGVWLPVLWAAVAGALKLKADTVFFWQALLEKGHQSQHKLCRALGWWDAKILYKRKKKMEESILCCYYQWHFQQGLSSHWRFNTMWKWPSIVFLFPMLHRQSNDRTGFKCPQ